MSEPSRQQHPEVLVAPIVTLATVIVLIGIARIYDHLPVKAPECSFKKALGIPCAGCGGTRSMQALAHGKFVEAFQYNPAVIIGVVAAFGWMIHGWIRFRRGDDLLPPSEHSKKVKTVVISVFGILVLNWIYLILFLE